MVKLDLVVIGGGYWGAGIAYEARAKGWKVLVVDDGIGGASRAASGICDPVAYKSKIFQKFWPSDWSKSDLAESLDWLVKRGAVPTTEGFLNHFAGTDRRAGAKCLYIPGPNWVTTLAGETVTASAVHIATMGLRWDIELTSGKCLATDRIVVAAGYRTDEVLVQAGLKSLVVRRLYGRGILASGTPQIELPVSVMIRPYCKHTVREWGGLWKVGDTAEEYPNDKKLESLRTVGNLVLENYQEQHISEGFRPVLDRYTVEKLDYNFVVATGGHRVGLGLTGLVAKKVMEMFS